MINANYTCAEKQIFAERESGQDDTSLTTTEQSICLPGVLYEPQHARFYECIFPVTVYDLLLPSPLHKMTQNNTVTTR